MQLINFKTKKCTTKNEKNDLQLCLTHQLLDIIIILYLQYNLLIL